MPKMSDVQVKDGPKSIRDIPVPDRSKRSEYFPSGGTPQRKRRNHKKDESGGLLWKILLALGVIVVVVGGYVTSTYFSSLKVFISPAQYTENYSSLPVKIISSSEIGSQSKENDTLLPYSLVRIESKESVALEATSLVKVEEKAKGTLTVFNESTPTPITLVANTRFQSTNGYIYRISKGVSVPGYTKKGNTILPGRLDVIVTADKAGELYNLLQDDFTIPGFKGTAHYSKVFARSKTPITGGFVGDKPAITQATKDNAISDLKTKLKAGLEAKVATAAPKGSIYFLSLARVSFDSPVETVASTTSIISLNMVADMPVFLASDFDLTRTISVVEEDVKEESAKVIFDISKLSAVPDGKPILSFIGKETVNFSGTAVYIATLPETDISNALKGVSRKRVTAVLSQFPMIDAATVKFIPFWLAKAPSDITKIKIINTIAGVDE